MRASVNPDHCSGCRICNNLCPFNAITFPGRSATSRRSTRRSARAVAPAWRPVPAGAITGSHFSNVQVMAQIEGILLTALASQAAAELVPA